MSSTTGTTGSTTTGNDPHQYVTNPPSTLIKIQNVVMKPELNGQYGLIVNYDTTKQRYMIVLAQQQSQVVALKVENLQLASASLRDRIMAQYQMMQHNPQFQQQVQTIHDYILQHIVTPVFRTLHITTPPRIHYFFMLLLVGLVTLWYLVGITKLVVLLTIILVLMSLVGSDLMQGRVVSLRHLCLTTIPREYTRMVQQEVPYGRVIVSKPWYLRSFTTLLLLFVAYTLFGTPTHSRFFGRPTKQQRSSSVPSPTPWMSKLLLPGFGRPTRTVDPVHHRRTTTTISREQMEEYYKLGFDDATQQLEFGTSLNHHSSNNDATLATDENTGIDGSNGSSSSSSSSGSSQSVLVNDDGTTRHMTEDSRNDAWKNTAYDRDPRIYDDDDDDDIVHSTRTSKSSSPFSFATGMAIFTIYRILQPIVTMSMHDNRMDWNLLRANLVTQMNAWKIIIVAFSLYRIMVAFF